MNVMSNNAYLVKKIIFLILLLKNVLMIHLIVQIIKKLYLIQLQTV